MPPSTLISNECVLLCETHFQRFIGVLQNKKFDFELAVQNPCIEPFERQRDCHYDLMITGFIYD